MRLLLLLSLLVLVVVVVVLLLLLLLCMFFSSSSRCFVARCFVGCLVEVADSLLCVCVRVRACVRACVFGRNVTVCAADAFSSFRCFSFFFFFFFFFFLLCSARRARARNTSQRKRVRRYALLVMQPV